MSFESRLTPIVQTSRRTATFEQPRSLMSMRAITATVICTALVLVVVPVGASGSVRRPPPSCAPRHTHVVVADRQAVVYRGPRIDEGTPEPEDPEFYGCVRPHGRSYLLGIPPSYGSPSGSGGTRTYTLGGPVVAFEEFNTTNLVSYYRYEEEIVVRDLRDGRVLHRLATGTGNSPLERKHGDVGIGGVTRIVVKGDGAVAWIVAVDGLASEYQVHAVDSTGNHVLAVGPSIEPKSLRLNGSVLHWTQGGKRLSATLR
jgi:hypothetical protein